MKKEAKKKVSKKEKKQTVWTTKGSAKGSAKWTTKKTTQKNTHYVEISAQTHESLMHLKDAFEEMTEMKNMELEDVINVLVQWFVESIQSDQWGCCGGQESDGACCKE